MIPTFDRPDPNSGAKFMLALGILIALLSCALISSVFGPISVPNYSSARVTASTAAPTVTPQPTSAPTQLPPSSTNTGAVVDGSFERIVVVGALVFVLCTISIAFGRAFILQRSKNNAQYAADQIARDERLEAEQRAAEHRRQQLDRQKALDDQRWLDGRQLARERFWREVFRARISKRPNKTAKTRTSVKIVDREPTKTNGRVPDAHANNGYASHGKLTPPAKPSSKRTINGKRRPKRPTWRHERHDDVDLYGEGGK